MSMIIKDLHGSDITVTDLEMAIAQTELFKDFGYTEPSPEQLAANRERKAYWTDLHEKLLELQSAFD